MTDKPRYALITIAIVIGLYIAGLFIHLPIAVSGSGWVSDAAGGVYRVLYRPVINALGNDNWLKIQWQNYSAFWCEKYPEGCSSAASG